MKYWYTLCISGTMGKLETILLNLLIYLTMDKYKNRCDMYRYTTDKYM